MGFLFLVLYPLRPPHPASRLSSLHILSPNSHITQSLTHSHIHTSHTHTLITLTSDLITLTHTHLHPLNHTSSLSHTHISSLSHSPTRTHTHRPTLTSSHLITLTLTHTHHHSQIITLTHTHIITLTRALPRGRMYALASLRCPLVSAVLPVAFVWQARRLVHCQGVGFLRGRRGTWCTAKGSDVRPGVPPVSLGLRRSAGGFCVVGVALAFAWQARRLVHCQGVGCTPWHPSGVLWSPPLLRGRRGAWCIPKGSDVRPGVPPVSLGLRRFCVAGVALRREDYIYIVTETYIIGFLYMCRKHITISPYDHTHA